MRVIRSETYIDLDKEEKDVLIQAAQVMRKLSGVFGDGEYVQGRNYSVDSKILDEMSARIKEMVAADRLEIKEGH